MPVAADPPVTPLTDQVTAVFVVPVTVDVKACDALSITDAVAGATATPTLAETTVSDTLPLVTAPGAGCRTATRRVPGAAADDEASIFVGET